MLVIARLRIVLLSLCAGCTTNVFALDAGRLDQDVKLYAARMYQEALDQARASYRLDTDTALLARSNRILRTLIRQAEIDDPAIEKFEWELHVVDDADANGSCLAGGKILLGREYIQALSLTDPELAMLIAHEMAHAILRHHIQEYRKALEYEPDRGERPFTELAHAIDEDFGLMRKLDPFIVEQELEADRAGLLLAKHAGWSTEQLIAFIGKLRRASGHPNFDGPEHPAPSRRLRALRDYAQTLQ